MFINDKKGKKNVEKILKKKHKMAEKIFVEHTPHNPVRTDEEKQKQFKRIRIFGFP